MALELTIVELRYTFEANILLKGQIKLANTLLQLEHSLCKTGIPSRVTDNVADWPLE